MKRESAARGMKWTRLLALALTAAALIHGAVNAFELWNSRNVTSVPWWSGFVFAALYYSLPISFCLAAYLFFRWTASDKE